MLSITQSAASDRIEDYAITPTGMRDLQDLSKILRSTFIHDPSGLWDWNEVFGNTNNVTWLRDPVDRAISQIRMIGRWTDEEAGQMEGGRRLRDAAREGVGAFIALDDDQSFANLYNGMTHFFQFKPAPQKMLWQAGKFMGARQLEAQARETALRNLEKMHFIGFVETFPESFSRLCDFLEIDEPRSLQHLNVKRTAQFSDEDRELVVPYVEIDQMLYDYALEIAGGRPAEVRPTGGGILPGSVLVSADALTSGDGWHVCEINGRKMSRWAGPGGVSRIKVPMEKGKELMLRLRVSDFVRPWQLENLFFTVDGSDVGVNLYPVAEAGLIAEAVVAAEALNAEDPYLIIDIHYGQSYRSGDSNDERMLGIEVCELEIGPRAEYELGTLGLFSRRLY